METEFIAWLREQLPAHPKLLLGPGDDAALLRLTDERDVVVTSDLLTDGVDFRLDQCDAWRVGRKALAVNLSDLAAMAAEPIAVIVSVALPRRDAGPLARHLYQGLLELASRYDVAVAGGDTNTWDGGLVICVTAIGQVTSQGALRRDGARPNDLILVTGSFGGSILGKHFDFEPRIEEALLLHRRYELHAGIDVSDGLSLDLSRMAAESTCGAAISLPAIPIAPAAYELAGHEDRAAAALRHALTDGEDFELVLAVPQQQAEQILRDQPLAVPVSCIGRIIPQLGLWQIDATGSLQALPAEGFEHR